MRKKFYLGKKRKRNTVQSSTTLLETLETEGTGRTFFNSTYLYSFSLSLSLYIYIKHRLNKHLLSVHGCHVLWPLNKPAIGTIERSLFLGPLL